MPRPLLLLLGDSLTELGSDWQTAGWVSLLLNRFNRAADIAQRGMAGYSTQWFIDLVITKLSDDLATTLRPSLTTLWLGANDAALLDGPSGFQHVPLDQFTTNLRALVAMLKSQAPQSELLLMTPPPVDEDVRRQYNAGRLDRSINATREYSDAIVAVAAEAGVQVLDVNKFFLDQPNGQWKTLLSDGLHFTSSGNQYVEQLLASTIQTRFPALQKKLEQVEYPRWSPSGPVIPPPSDLSNALHVRRSLTVNEPLKLALDVDQRQMFGSFNDAFLLAVLACGLFVGMLSWRSIRRRKQTRSAANEGESLITK